MRIQALAPAGVTEAVAALRPRAERAREVEATVARIIESVRERGDLALVEATARLDWPGASRDALRVPEEQLESALASLDPELERALEVAREDVSWFHRHEVRSGWRATGPYGQSLGIRYLPVRRAGLYVPGGLGSYASTVIMNAVPAQVAGVEQLCICTPPGHDGAVNLSVLAAARFMGVAEVYRVGGAQAVAAMAFGTGTIPRVDVICGPGNAYVMEAKRQVYGAVGIDGLAGPSEVVVVADGAARPDWVAADLLAQEEHGSGAVGILVGHDEGFCRAVTEAVAALRGAAPALGGRSDGAEPDPGLARGPSGGKPRPSGGKPSLVDEEPEAEASSRLYAFYPAPGAAFPDLAEAFIDEYAPEHLELHLVDAEAFLPRVRSAGAVFVGGSTPTAFGDYVAGSNHVLPTGGAARFSSPLSVDTFVRSSSVVALDAESGRALTPHLARLARSEGFAFHRISAELRFPPDTPLSE